MRETTYEQRLYERLAVQPEAFEEILEAEVGPEDDQELRRRLSINLTAIRKSAEARPILEELLPGPMARAWAKGAEIERWDPEEGRPTSQLYRNPLRFYDPVLQRGRHLPAGMKARREELARRVAVLTACGPRGIQQWIADALGVERRLVARLAAEGR